MNEVNEYPEYDFEDSGAASSAVRYRVAMMEEWVRLDRQIQESEKKVKVWQEDLKRYRDKRAAIGNKIQAVVTDNQKEPSGWQ